MIVEIGSVRAFPDVRPDKAQALKVVEEAAEVYSAWQDWNDNENKELMEAFVLNEVADCVTACANLAAALGCDSLENAINMAEVRNRLRGRYKKAQEEQGANDAD